MRKSLFIVVLCALFLVGTRSAYSQLFNAGLIGGATFSQVDGDKYAGFHKIGMTAGTYVNLPVANHFALQMELKYTQMGAHSSDEESELTGYGPYNLVLHYAEIPLMLQYDFSHFTVYGKSLDFITLELGVSLDFLLAYRGKIEHIDQDWNLNFFSVTGNFGLAFRLMYSITPMQTNPTPQWFFNHSYNKVIQLTLTYNFYSPLR